MRGRRAAGARRAVLLAALLGACARQGPRAAHNAAVVAMVGERPVTFADLAAYVKRAAGDEIQAVSPQVASSLLDQLVEERLLDRAVEDAVPPPPGLLLPEKRRALIGREAALEKITDAELRREYDAHPERFVKREEVRASQMLFAKPADAHAAVKRLEKGEPWLEVSRSASQAPNAATGGAVGVLGRGDLPREFEEIVFKLKPGQRSAPVAAPDGVHLFQVEERRDGRTLPFEEASAGLRLSLAEERSQEAVGRLIARSRTAHPPAVIEEHLPFPYVGALPRYVEPAR